MPMADICRKAGISQATCFQSEAEDDRLLAAEMGGGSSSEGGENDKLPSGVP